MPVRRVRARASAGGRGGHGGFHGREATRGPGAPQAAVVAGSSAEKRHAPPLLRRIRRFAPLRGALQTMRCGYSVLASAAAMALKAWAR